MRMERRKVKRSPRHSQHSLGPIVLGACFAIFCSSYNVGVEAAVVRLKGSYDQGYR